MLGSQIRPEEEGSGESCERASWVLRDALNEGRDH